MYSNYKDGFNKKSRNQRSINKQFSTNKKLNNITFYKDNKSLLNNSTLSERKSINRQKMNQSFIFKKPIANVCKKKRIVKTIKPKPNNDSIKLSLKQKIHLFQQKKEALIKQYSNKNKILINSGSNNISKKFINKYNK